MICATGNTSSWPFPQRILTSLRVMYVGMHVTRLRIAVISSFRLVMSLPVTVASQLQRVLLTGLSLPSWLGLAAHPGRWDGIATLLVLSHVAVGTQRHQIRERIVLLPARLDLSCRARDLMIDGEVNPCLGIPFDRLGTPAAIGFVRKSLACMPLCVRDKAAYVGLKREPAEDARACISHQIVASAFDRWI